MSKAKVLSVSTLYATVELLEPASIKQGDTIDLPGAIKLSTSVPAPTPPVPPAAPMAASVTTKTNP